MKLEKWALIAETLGSVAIVISLIVLITQVRANTEAVLVSSRQSIAVRAQDLALTLVDNRDLNDAVTAAIEGRGQLLTVHFASKKRFAERREKG